MVFSSFFFGKNGVLCRIAGYIKRGGINRSIFVFVHNAFERFMPILVRSKKSTELQSSFIIRLRKMTLT